MPAEEKTRLHPRNKNRERYDLEALKASSPGLKNFIKPNKFGAESIDFANPDAVRILNKALLKHYYGINNWEFPKENLCPPIPGRADYLHYVADVLSDANNGKIPKGEKITVLDVGMGSSCIYPIIGVVEYGWSFIGSDVDSKSVFSAQQIVDSNKALKSNVACKLQENKNFFFKSIIGTDSRIEFSISNPPFHASAKDAKNASRRKVKNLTGKKVESPVLNFSGISNELIYNGGEYKFIHDMIIESKKYAKNCLWFSSFVSNKNNLKGITKTLAKIEAAKTKVISLGTGNKSSNIVLWSFLSEKEQLNWFKSK
jgi:23S rRNA (adenine1618-N6)-methyltransferase